MKNVLFQENLIVVRDFVGGICGWNSGTIRECYTRGVINDTATQKKDEYSPRAGGICGRSESGNIVLSYNKANVKMSANMYDPGVGGICGYTVGGEVLNCYNRGSLSLTFDPSNLEVISCLQLGGI